MGSERKKYVMPGELAMRREMAYREKLEGLAMARGASTVTIGPDKDTLLPAPQVPTTTPSQTPSTLAMPTPNQCPPPTLRHPPHQRPHPYFGPRPGQAPQPRPMAPMPPGPRSRPNPPHSTHHHRKRKEPAVPQPGDFFCNICQVDCTSEFNLKMHFRGHKHKAKLKEVKSMKPPAGDGIEVNKTKKPHCELCGIFCPDKNSFRQHLNGKNHTLKLLATEKKMKGPDGRIALS